MVSGLATREGDTLMGRFEIFWGFRRVWCGDIADFSGLIFSGGGIFANYGSWKNFSPVRTENRLIWMKNILPLLPTEF
jgi:hypothetical protein